ncbi:hypothetical protein F4804DRAFT_310823 [Jackrogersella minutella]|nr:hypothetical protein F4804DRAFT_310823 [Jackrogersella minutella]
MLIEFSGWGLLFCDLFLSRNFCLHLPSVTSGKTRSLGRGPRSGRAAAGLPRDYLMISHLNPPEIVQRNTALGAWTRRTYLRLVGGWSQFSGLGSSRASGLRFTYLPSAIWEPIFYSGLRDEKNQRELESTAYRGFSLPAWGSTIYSGVSISLRH